MISYILNYRIGIIQKVGHGSIYFLRSSNGDQRSGALQLRITLFNLLPFLDVIQIIRVVQDIKKN